MWILGIGLEQREALKTHQGFFGDLVKLIKSELKQAGNIETPQELEVTRERIRESFPLVFDTEVLLWRVLLEQGHTIVERLMAVILDAPSRDVADFYVDTLVDICNEMPAAYKQLWFTNAFQRTPGNVLTEEEKLSHLNYLVQPHKKKDGLIENFDMIAKRARNAKNRGN